jgi:hypothetical protein
VTTPVWSKRVSQIRWGASEWKRPGPLGVVTLVTMPSRSTTTLAVPALLYSVIVPLAPTASSIRLATVIYRAVVGTPTDRGCCLTSMTT